MHLIMSHSTNPHITGTATLRPMTFGQLREAHRERRAGNSALKDELSAFDSFLELTLKRSLEDQEQGEFGARFKELTKQHAANLAALPAGLSKSTIGPKISRLNQVAKTRQLAIVTDGVPQEFSPALAELIRRAGLTPHLLAKRIVAAHPEMGSARKGSPRHASLGGKLRNWCLKCMPDSRCDLKLIRLIEAELSCPEVLQSKLPYMKHAIVSDPALAERDPDTGLPIQFGMLVRHFRRAKHFSIDDLHSRLGVHIDWSRVERGVNNLADFHRGDIERLDDLLGADGAIVRAYDANGTSYHNLFAKRCTNTRREKYAFWNDYLEREFQDFKAFKQDFERPRAKGYSHHWDREGTVGEVRYKLSLFLGYLKLSANAEDPRLRGLGFDEHRLSIVLMADKDLLRAFIDFLSNRVGSYTATTERFLRLARSLVSPEGYFRKHPEVFVNHPHFRDKLPLKRSVAVSSSRSIEVELKAEERGEELCTQVTRWCDTVLGNLKSTKPGRQFRKGQFSKGRLKSILREENPYRLLIQASEILKECQPSKATQPVVWALFIRDWLLLEMLSDHPNRPQTITDLRYPETINHTCEGRWYAESDGAEIKNGREWKGADLPPEN